MKQPGLRRRLIFTVLLTLVALTTLGLWGDLRQAGPALKGFPWLWLPAIAFFGFMNDFIKFLRWNLYLRKLELKVPLADSLRIFLSGLSMSATPGKVGLLLKSHMLKKCCGRSLMANSPIVMAELYMDIIALAIISLMGLNYMGPEHRGWLLALCLVPLVGLVPRVPEYALELLGRTRLFAGRASSLHQALTEMFGLFGPATTARALAITLLAWVSEGVALCLIVSGLGYEISLMRATVIFGFSTLLGAVSMLPGGLIVTDAGLMGLLVSSGLPTTPAAVAALLARLFTLWLAVAVGSLTLIFSRAYLSAAKGEV